MRNTALVSQQNVEIVQQIFDAFSKRDMKAALAPMHPEIEWVTPPGAPNPSWHGHDGVRSSLTEWTGSFDSFRFEPLEFIDADDRVLVDVALSVRGRESDVDIRSHQFQVWTLSEGKVIRMEMFSEKGEALEAAGLRQQGSAG
jgi:uncharacterized protein